MNTMKKSCGWCYAIYRGSCSTVT